MKRKIIIVVLVLLCFVSIILGVYFIVHNNSSDKYTLESIRYEYLNSDRKVVAAVNDVDITNKELCLIQYSSHTNKPLEKAIEQKAIVQLAEADSFSLSESEENKEIEYITTQYEKLNLPDNEENNAFCDALIKEHLEMTTSVKYQYHIQKQIMRQSFSSDNKAINEKYEKYKSIYKEWEDGGKENSKLYKKIWSLREEIAQEYIQKRMEINRNLEKELTENLPYLESRQIKKIVIDFSKEQDKL